MIRSGPKWEGEFHGCNERFVASKPYSIPFNIYRLPYDISSLKKDLVCLDLPNIIWSVVNRIDNGLILVNCTYFFQQIALMRYSIFSQTFIDRMIVLTRTVKSTDRCMVDPVGDIPLLLLLLLFLRWYDASPETLNATSSRHYLIYYWNLINKLIIWTKKILP